jgi:hypothetical protein
VDPLSASIVCAHADRVPYSKAVVVINGTAAACLATVATISNAIIRPTCLNILHLVTKSSAFMRSGQMAPHYCLMLLLRRLRNEYFSERMNLINGSTYISAKAEPTKKSISYQGISLIFFVRM